MLEKLNLLALNVQEFDPDIMTAAEREALAQENRTKIIWIVVLAVVLLACLYFAFLHPKVKKYIQTRKKKKEETLRDAELERLHRSKRLNKRK